MPQRNRSGPFYSVWSFCSIMRGQLPPFMDDTKVVKAIQSDDPAKVTTLANEYITTFFNSFDVFRIDECNYFIGFNQHFIVICSRQL